MKSHGCLILLLLASVLTNPREIDAQTGDADAVSTASTPIDAAIKSIDENALRQHINFLASDTLEGREAGSRGGQAAATYLVEKLKETGMQPAGIGGEFFQPFGGTTEYRNILALLPGTDPVLRSEYIVIGAHYDHVGYGNATNSYGPFGQIHNGADDNASGCSTLLELMKAIRQSGFQSKRSILFAFWDGEEKNLLGSKHFVSAPLVPLSQIKLVINVDMVGRLKENRMEMLGTRTAAGLRRFVSERNLEAIDVDFSWDVVADSDHYPFVERQIPYLMPFTDKHEDYHRPSDDPERLNFPGMQRVARFVLRLLTSVANADSLPRYRPRCRVESEGTRRGFERAQPKAPPRLGVQTNQDSNSMLTVRNVLANTSAAIAGFRTGDRILQFNGIDVTAETFTQVVQASPRQCTARVKRNGEVTELNVQFADPPRRLGIAWRTDACEPGTRLLTRVVAGSPAAVAGLQNGDRIYSVDGKTVISDEDFLAIIKQSTQLNLAIERRGRIFAAEVKLLPPTQAP